MSSVRSTRTRFRHWQAGDRLQSLNALKFRKQFPSRCDGQSIQRRYCHEHRILLRAQHQTSQGIAVGNKGEARLSEWFIVKRSYFEKLGPKDPCRAVPDELLYAD